MALRARETFWAPRNRLVREGQIVDDRDWVIEGREELFDPMPGAGLSADATAELLDRIKSLETALAGKQPAKATKATPS